MDLIALLTQWGIPLVFAAVLLEQSGVPVPAPPILVVAGALAAEGSLHPEFVLFAAVAACLIADHGWFLLGRRYGRRLLSTLCRVSLSPDTCVRKTDDLIGRHGAPLLLVAKFIPGVSAVAIPTAAAMGLPYRRFITYDALGCLAWSGAYVGAGVIFSREIERVLGSMSWAGGGTLAVLLALLAIYIGAKALHRHRLRRLHRLVRISPEDVARLLEEEPDAVILDARSALARAEDPRRLTRSIVLEERKALDVLPPGRRDRTVITFCTCPNEASAALLAEELIRAGYVRVRVLTGGSDAVEVLTDSLQARIAREGFAWVAADVMRPLVAAEGALADWPAFAASWSDLALDTHLPDGHRYRRRRHATLSARAGSTEFRVEPHAPHYQSLDYNPLAGGIERWFEPILPEVLAGPSFQGIARFCLRLFGSLRPETDWHIECHQFRIEARRDAAGLPTPEGVHRDGVDYVLVLLVNRTNIESGTTTVHDLEGRQLGSFTLSTPLDAALVDDARVKHGVTAVHPMDAEAPAYRDVLVVTFRSATMAP